MVSNLSDFFRHCLSKGEDVITLAEEERHVRSYLQIQQARYKDIMEYAICIDPGLQRARLPKLTLQPLVENAIYHGMEFMDGDGEIVVKVCRQQESLLFMIQDNGLGMTKEQVQGLLTEKNHSSSRRGSGIGVKNVNERIRLYFGEEYGLSIQSEPDEGTVVKICLPAVPFDELAEGEEKP